MGTFEVWILMKNNSIIKKKTTNPNDTFELTYSFDGEKKTMPFKFEKDSIFYKKWFMGLFTKRIMFYEHGNIHPLKPKFISKNNEVKELATILETGLLKQMSDSVKDKAKLMSMWLVLGIVGIIALVLIVV